MISHTTIGHTQHASLCPTSRLLVAHLVVQTARHSAGDGRESQVNKRTRDNGTWFVELLVMY